MNCAYHSVNTAVVNCNGCGRPLCPACDHRIKGFPFCQDCIVTGVGLLRDRQSSMGYVPLVKKQTSPILATLLSMLFPGLGAAYNGQSSKALIHFAVFVGLFQMAVSTGVAFFVLGFFGMWLYAAVDAYKSAQLIRSGITPEAAEDVIMQRLSANPKLWAVVLLGLGGLFLLQNFLPLKNILKAAIPILIIALGLYLLRKYVLGAHREKQPVNYLGDSSSGYSGSYTDTSFRTGEFDSARDRRQTGGWRG